MAKKKSMEDKIDDLALSVAKGFDEVYHRMDQGEGRLGERLDRIEYLITGQERRVSILEDRVRQLANKAGLNFN
jgi:hypothetical protein